MILKFTTTIPHIYC